jgi:hypothetical protein
MIMELLAVPSAEENNEVETQDEEDEFFKQIM